MSEWVFVSLLHNLSIDQAVENKHVAIVPDSDPRALSLIEATPALERLINGFTDQFGRRVSPSLMIIHSRAPKTLFALDALIGFRNAFAISSIIQAWQEALVKNQSMNVLKYSNYFDLYPITIGKDGDSMIIRSPSILGMDEPEEFVGQISPELASSHRVTAFYDNELIKAILLVWDDRFLKRATKDWRSRVLFRSLEMAFHASTIPFENSSTMYDYGAKIALWVSAFEVLVRSETEQASLSRRVLALLSGSRVYLPRLGRKLYTIQFSKKIRKRCTLPQKLYHMLHSARNDFLHGNPVEHYSVFVKNSARYHPLTAAAPLLYKLALQSFLQIAKREDLFDYDISDFMNIRNFEEAMCALIQKRPQRKTPRPTKA